MTYDVWVVLFSVPYEGDEFKGVFRTVEGAKAELETNGDRKWKGEWKEVDGGWKRQGDYGDWYIYSETMKP